MDLAGRRESLESYVKEASPLLGDDWLGSLDDRKVEEATFHDADREGHRDELDPEASKNRRFYEAAGGVRESLNQWIRTTAPGAIFLDYACGNGLYSIEAAKAGAEYVVGIDISPTSVENATRTAASHDLTPISFLQRDCESTTLPDGVFDAVLCSGMLHHLDLNSAFPELARIMAPGGRIYCQEALEYNPVIQLYRNRTPELRTRWEKDHILGMKDIKFAKRWFRVENLRFYLMVSPLATFLPSGAMRRAGLSVGRAVDSVLTRVPLLRYWSWQFSFELVKE
jgi:SAM-dependent methyltransferase